jgi:hypothetical protein
MQMHMRCFTLLMNAFSKKIKNRARRLPLWHRRQLATNFRVEQLLNAVS